MVEPLALSLSIPLGCSTRRAEIPRRFFFLGSIRPIGGRGGGCFLFFFPPKWGITSKREFDDFFLHSWQVDA